MGNTDLYDNAGLTDQEEPDSILPSKRKRKWGFILKWSLVPIINIFLLIFLSYVCYDHLEYWLNSFNHIFRNFLIITFGFVGLISTLIWTISSEKRDRRGKRMILPFFLILMLTTAVPWYYTSNDLYHNLIRDFEKRFTINQNLAAHPSPIQGRGKVEGLDRDVYMLLVNTQNMPWVPKEACDIDLDYYFSPIPTEMALSLEFTLPDSFEVDTFKYTKHGIDFRLTYTKTDEGIRIHYYEEDW